MRRMPRWNVHGAAKTHHRVEYGTHGAGKRPPIDDRDGIAKIAAASDEPRPIRFVLQVAAGLALYHYYMRHPHGGLVIRPFPACGEKSSDIRNKFRFDEQICK